LEKREIQKPVEMSNIRFWQHSLGYSQMIIRNSACIECASPRSVSHRYRFWEYASGFGQFVSVDAGSHNNKRGHA